MIAVRSSLGPAILSVMDAWDQILKIARHVLRMLIQGLKVGVSVSQIMTPRGIAVSTQDNVEINVTRTQAVQMVQTIITARNVMKTPSSNSEYVSAKTFILGINAKVTWENVLIDVTLVTGHLVVTVSNVQRTRFLMALSVFAKMFGLEQIVTIT